MPGIRARRGLRSMNDSRPLQVVLGAGQVGSRLVSRLVGGGQRVRAVRQSPIRSTLAGVEQAHGDITDLGFLESSTAGAAVVYDCMNPPYLPWDELLLARGRGVLHGAGSCRSVLATDACVSRDDSPVGNPLCPGRHPFSAHLRFPAHTHRSSRGLTASMGDGARTARSVRPGTSCEAHQS